MIRIFFQYGGVTEVIGLYAGCTLGSRNFPFFCMALVIQLFHLMHMHNAAPRLAGSQRRFCNPELSGRFRFRLVVVHGTLGSPFFHWYGVSDYRLTPGT